MKEFKSFDDQLTILRKRGMIIPEGREPKRFLEQENYYNVINGYKSLFLCKDEYDNIILPEKYLPNTNFDELKSLFLFDRELRFLFLKYLLIFENSFKTVMAHEFSKKYTKGNSYLDITNYRLDEPKVVLSQITILMKVIHDNLGKEGAIKHYIETHGTVPLWVLVNYLTIGNLSYLYSALKESEKNTIAKYYSYKYSEQYEPSNFLKITAEDISAALKIFNLIRNQCAHDERLFNTDYKNMRVKNITKYFNIKIYSDRRIVVAILYFKVLLNKNYYNNFHEELVEIFKCYEKKFHTVEFNKILEIMGIDSTELKKLE